MKQAEIAARLILIEERLTAIEASVADRSAPASNVRAALADIEASYGLIGQMAEVAHAQREQIEALIGRIDRLLALLTAHDQRLAAHDKDSQDDRGELKALMTQLRELARKQVAGLADVERAMQANDEPWSGEERRRDTMLDRRRAS